MKLKRDEHGHVVVVDGNPVYIHEDGKEIPFDAAGTVATIARINGEAKGHREAKEAAQTALKVFEGLDAAAARKAIETVANLDAKKLIDAGEVERIKTEAKAAYEGQLRQVEEKYAPIVKERDQFAADLVAEKVGGAFSRSKFISEKLAIPADLAQARFGSQFKVENGSVFALDAAGNKLLSRAKPGEIAGFEEAMEILVDSYPHKDSILKGSGAFGGGATGGGAGGKRTITRAQFDGMDPNAQHTTALAVGKGEFVLTD